jgi:hypothetical protein
MEDNIFNYIDSILYKKSLKDSNVEFAPQYNSYLINRWISMYSIDMANIINSTSNVYGAVMSKEEHYKLLYNLISKCSKKKINYIKKPKQSEDTCLEDINELSEVLELSKREVKELIDLTNILNK